MAQDPSSGRATAFGLGGEERSRGGSRVCARRGLGADGPRGNTEEPVEEVGEME
jgi:hypothetical protein